MGRFLNVGVSVMIRDAKSDVYRSRDGEKKELTKCGRWWGEELRQSQGQAR